MGLIPGGNQSGFSFNINNYSGSSTVTPPQEVRDAYSAMLNRINTVSQTPWQNYSTNPWDFVAPMNGWQMDVAREFGNNNWRATPYVDYAMGQFGAANNIYNASNQWGASAGQNIASQSIAALSDPYYQWGQNYTNYAANAPGGYQVASPFYQSAYDSLGNASQNAVSWATPWYQGAADYYNAAGNAQGSASMASPYMNAAMQGYGNVMNSRSTDAADPFINSAMSGYSAAMNNRATDAADPYMGYAMSGMAGAMNNRSTDAADPYFQASTAYYQGAGAAPGGTILASPFYNNAANYYQNAASAPGSEVAASPYMDNAYNLVGAGGQRTNQVSQEDIQRYMSPYQQGAINPTLDLMKQSNEQAMQGALGNIIKGGGMGNDRAGVMMSNLNQQNQMATAKMMGDMQAANYNQAAQYAAGQRAQNQADLGRQLQAGAAYGQLGASAAQMRNADLARVMQAGQGLQSIGTDLAQLNNQDLARLIEVGQGLGNLGTAYGQLRGQDLNRMLQAGQSIGQLGINYGQLRGMDLARMLQAGESLGNLGINYGQLRSSDLNRYLQASQGMQSVGMDLGQLNNMDLMRQIQIGQGFANIGTDLGNLRTADLNRYLQAGIAYGNIGTAAGQLQQADLNRILAAGMQTANIGTLQRQAYEYQQQVAAADMQRRLAIGQLYNANAQGVGNIGNMAGNMGLGYQTGIMNNLMQQYAVATQMQKTDQAARDALYNQYLQQMSYPFETSQFALDALAALGPQYGSTTQENGSSSGLQWRKSGGRVNKRSGGSLGEKPEVVGKTFDGQDIYRYRYKDGGPAQIGLMADEVAPRYPNAVVNLGGKLAVDYARATDKAAGLGRAMGAGRQHFMFGGKEEEKVRSFVPKLNVRPGQMMVSRPRGAPTPTFMPPREKQNNLAGLAQLANNAQGLYSAFKGLGGTSGLSGMFNTAAATAAPAAAATVASAAPAAASTAADTIKDAGTKAVSTVADAGLGGLGGIASIFDPLEKLFAANGGAIPHFSAGGFSTVFDEEDQDRRRGPGSIVPKSSHPAQPTQMPVSHPNRQAIMGQDGGGGGQQNSGGGLGDMLGMATKGISAIGSLASSGGLGSILGGAGAAGAAGAGAAAAGGGGLLGGILSFLPFLGIFSDPSMKTGVGNRKGFSLGGPEDDEEKRRPLLDLAAIPVVAPVKPKEEIVIEKPKADLGAPKSEAKPVMVASAANPNFADDALPVTLKREGGYTPNDAGAGASNMGINRRSHPGEDIEHMTKERAGQIYKHDYWDAIGADNMDPRIRLMAYDAAVNQGPARARQWAEQSGGDPQKMAELRMAHYQSLIDKNPGQYGPYARAWAGRVNADLAKQGLGPMALHFNGHATTGHTGGPDYTGGGGGSDPRSWMALAQESPEDRAVKTGLALLSGVAGGLAGAAQGGGALGGIAGGLGSFGGAYQKIADADLDRQKFNWQQQRDMESMGIQRAQEGRAAEEYARTRRQNDEAEKVLKSAPGSSAAPAGGYGPKPAAPAPGLGAPAPIPAPVAPAAPATKPGLGGAPPAPAPAQPPMSVTPGPANPEVPVGVPPKADLGGVPPVADKVAAPAPAAPAVAAPAPMSDVRNLPNMAPNRPDPSKFWPTITPEQNPYYWSQQAEDHMQRYEKMRASPLLQGGANQELAYAQQAREKAAFWANQKSLMDVNGNRVENPYVIQTERDIARGDKQSEYDVANQNELIEVQREPGGPKTKLTKQQYLKEVQNGEGPATSQPGYTEKKMEKQYEADAAIPAQFDNRAKSRDRLERLTELLKTYKTGAFAEQKATIQKDLAALGIDVKDTDMMSAKNFEQFTKNAVANVFNDVKDMGGRVLVAEIEGLAKANANPSLTPEANRQLIGRALGQLDWADAYYRDYVKWRQDNPYKDEAVFKLDWMKDKEHSIKTFEEARMKDLKTAGSENPPAKEPAGVPPSLMDIRNSGNLQRKGDLYRDKSTGIVYDKTGKRVEQ